MTKRYLLDTNICVFFLQGRYNLREKMGSVGIANLCISEITVAELLYGAYNSENFSKHIAEVNDIVSLFTVVPIYSSLEEYARQKAMLRKAGRIIDDFDILIGATALHNDMVLVTDNIRHLSRLEGVVMENWTQK